MSFKSEAKEGAWGWRGTPPPPTVTLVQGVGPRGDHAAGGVAPEWLAKGWGCGEAGGRDGKE